MRIERAAFLTRLQSIRSACDESLLINTSSVVHNECAKQLRAGLCVMIFSALEDLIRERVAQVADHIGPASIPFASLPVSLQKAASSIALQSLAFQSVFIPDDQRLAFLVKELSRLGKLGDNYAISKYSFAHSKTNVQYSEFEESLRCFNVEKPAETVFKTAQRLQFGPILGTKEAFEKLASTRHSAAHKQSFDIPSVDLKGLVASALAIGITFDIVFSVAANNLIHSYANNHGHSIPLKWSDITLFTVSDKRVRGDYQLRCEGKQRLIYHHADINVVRADGLNRLAANLGAVVIQDASGQPSAWYCSDAGD